MYEKTITQAKFININKCEKDQKSSILLADKSANLSKILFKVPEFIKIIMLLIKMKKNVLETSDRKVCLYFLFKISLPNSKIEIKGIPIYKNFAKTVKLELVD